MPGFLLTVKKFTTLYLENLSLMEAGTVKRETIKTTPMDTLLLSNIKLHT